MTQEATTAGRTDGSPLRRRSHAPLNGGSDSLVAVGAAKLSVLPRSLTVHDGVVYVAVGSMGLELFSDHPQVGIRRVGSIEIVTPVTDVSTVGDFLYVGSSQGLHILPLQCSDVLAPTIGSR